MPAVLFCLIAGGRADDIRWLDDKIIRQTRQATVGILSRDGHASASGFFVSENGLVIACASTLEGLAEVVMFTSDNEEITGAKLVALDPLTDLAVLATGRRPPAFLTVHQKPVAANSSCAVVFRSGRAFKAADGVLLARRAQLDWTESRFLAVWSIAINPNMNGLTGAPVVTADGKVAGMCDFVTGFPPQKFVFAIPETAISTALEQARTAPAPRDFPRPGEVSRHGFSNTDPDYIEGMTRMSEGDPFGALDSFKSALRNHPKDPPAMIQVAACSRATGDVASAKRVLEELVRIAPERLQARAMLGMTLSEEGTSETTVRYFEELTTGFPEFAAAWGELGALRFDLGHKPAALAALKRHTELEPDSIHSWSVYAKALFATGDFDEATRAADRARELESILFKLTYSAPKRD